MIRVFGIIPSVTIPAFAIAAVWMLLAMVVAVRQALDYTSTARAVAVCALGWLLAIAIAVVLGLFFGPTVS
jgi:drug/metabolite transporter (DMT)-like permease